MLIVRSRGKYYVYDYFEIKDIENINDYFELKPEGNWEKKQFWWKKISAKRNHRKTFRNKKKEKNLFLIENTIGFKLPMDKCFSFSQWSFTKKKLFKISRGFFF